MAFSTASAPVVENISRSCDAGTMPSSILLVSVTSGEESPTWLGLGEGLGPELGLGLG